MYSKLSQLLQSIMLINHQADGIAVTISYLHRWTWRLEWRWQQQRSAWKKQLMPKWLPLLVGGCNAWIAVCPSRAEHFTPKAAARLRARFSSRAAGAEVNSREDRGQGSGSKKQKNCQFRLHADTVPNWSAPRGSN